MSHDAIVIGGSYAGMAAALQLARARRDVLVIDAGVRRNRFAERSHGLLGHDGRAPGDIVADAKAQLLAYPTVTWLDATVDRVAGESGGFQALADEVEHRGKRLVLATGVVDALPDLPGVERHWGRHVFHCPYCHGYELGSGRIGVLAGGPGAFHHAMVVSDWGETVLFLNGAFEPDGKQLQALQRRGVAIERAAVLELDEGEAGRAFVRLGDGRSEALDGLFVQTTAKEPSPLATMLGCAFEEGPFGAFIKTNENKETSVKGCYAAGDVARTAGNLSVAVADGMTAGVNAHQSLIFEE